MNATLFPTPADRFRVAEAEACIHAALARPEPVAPELVDRLAECLAAATDAPLLTLRDPDGNYPLELRLGSFNREISERAAELLEEAGR